MALTESFTERIPAVVANDAYGAAWAVSNKVPAQNKVYAAISGLSAVYQPLDATLTALAGQNWAANAIPIGSGADTVAQVAFAVNTFPARASTGNLVAKTISDVGLSLVAASTAMLARTALGIDNDDAVTFGDLTVNSLVVNGTVTTVNSATLTVDDPLIRLADNNAADSLDIGFYGPYVSSGTKYSGMFRDATDGKYRLFTGTSTEPTTTVNIGAGGYAVATIVAHLEDSSTNISGGSITGVTMTDSTAKFFAGNFILLDDSGLYNLPIIWAESDTANRGLNLYVQGASRNLTIPGDATISGTNTGDQLVFKTISVSGQPDVVADSITDTLTLVAGTGVSITTNAGTDSITINSTVSAYTDEQAQDAIGAMIDSSLVYVDGTPLLTRAALTGDVTATQGSNATTIANNAVTLAKLATQGPNTILANATAGTAVPTAVGISANKFLARDSIGNLAAQTVTDVALTLLAQSTQSAMRSTGLGLGTMATQAATAVAITGGTMSGVVAKFDSGGLKLFDDSVTYLLSLIWADSETANRGLQFFLGGASRNLTFTGGTNVSIGGTNTGDVTLAGTPNYITISGQVITRAAIDLASHVTGVLPIANGGGNMSSFGTSNAFVYYDGTRLVTGANGLWNGSQMVLAGSGTNSSLRVGSMEFQGYALNNTFWADNLYFDGGSWRYRATGYGSVMQNTNGSYEFFTVPSGSAGAAATVTLGRFRIDNAAGHITMKPDAGITNGLYVNGQNLASTTALNPGVLIYGDGSNNYGLDLGYLGATSKYRTRLFAVSSQDIAFSFAGASPTAQSNFTDAMVIVGTSGSVGINTPSPSAKFHVISTTEQARLGYDTSNCGKFTVSSAGRLTIDMVGSDAGVTFADSVTMADGKNLIFSTTTGSKLGSSSTEKIGVWGAPPVALSIALDIEAFTPNSSFNPATDTYEDFVNFTLTCIQWLQTVGWFGTA